MGFPGHWGTFLVPGVPQDVGGVGGWVAGGACVDAPGGRGGAVGCVTATCNFLDPLVRLASLFVLGASWIGLWACLGIATGCYERYAICGTTRHMAYGVWGMAYGVWRMAMAMASSCWLLGLGGLQRSEAEAAGTGALGLQLQLLSSQ
jgi:hypothetical protein